MWNPRRNPPGMTNDDVKRLKSKMGICYIEQDVLALQTQIAALEHQLRTVLSVDQYRDLLEGAAEESTNGQ